MSCWQSCLWNILERACYKNIVKTYPGVLHSTFWEQESDFAASYLSLFSFVIPLDFNIDNINSSRGE
jgi:hypothetical protein